MDLIVFENEAYQRLQRKLMKEFQSALEEAYKKALMATNAESDWISLQETKKLLGVKSKNKMQDLRDKGQIKFSRHGRTIKYSKKSILEFLEQHTKHF